MKKNELIDTYTKDAVKELLRDCDELKIVMLTEDAFFDKKNGLLRAVYSYTHEGNFILGYLWLGYMQREVYIGDFVEDHVPLYKSKNLENPFTRTDIQSRVNPDAACLDTNGPSETLTPTPAQNCEITAPVYLSPETNAPVAQAPTPIRLDTDEIGKLIEMHVMKVLIDKGWNVVSASEIAGKESPNQSAKNALIKELEERVDNTCTWEEILSENSFDLIISKVDKTDFPWFALEIKGSAKGRKGRWELTVKQTKSCLELDNYRIAILTYGGIERENKNEFKLDDPKPLKVVKVDKEINDGIKVPIAVDCDIETMVTGSDRAFQIKPELVYVVERLSLSN